MAKVKPSLASRNASATFGAGIKTGNNGHLGTAFTGKGISGPPQSLKHTSIHDHFHPRTGNIAHPEPSTVVPQRTSNPTRAELAAKGLVRK